MDRMDTHVKVLSWLYIILGAMGVLSALCIFILLFGIGAASGDRTAVGVLGVIGVVAAGFILMTSAPGIVAGIGLLRYQQWARILALVLGVLNLPGFPIGTLLGVYTIWALLDEESQPLFTPSAAS